MVDDTTRKLATAIKSLQHDVKRLLSGRWLENSSVRGGRLRFIGGVLRLDSGALLDLIGQWRFRGNGAITGDVYSEGRWTQVGPWDFTGTGRVYGSVEVLDNGRIKVGNVIISPESNGRITVGVGASQIVIDGGTGRITVNGMTIDPADGGKITFPGGAQLRADVGNGIQMQIGSVKISAQESFVQLTIGTRSIIINSAGISATLPTVALASAPAGAYVGAIIGNASNQMFRVVA